MTVRASAGYLLTMAVAGWTIGRVIAAIVMAYPW